MKNNKIIEFKGITKTFLNGKIVANKDVTFSVKENSVHAIAGENGAGKSTLMSMLFGLYKPTKGTVVVKGEEINYSNAADAMKAGIGMVHQHFQLVDRFTVAENILLGREITKFGFIQRKKVGQEIDKLIEKYKFNLKSKDKISKLSVGQEQKVEILKLLYSDAEIMIFDEPTAMLTPDEIEEFFEIVSKLKKQGKTIILITHKLDEIKKMADEVSVLRKGEYIGTLPISQVTPDKLSKMMIGRVAKKLDLPKNTKGEVVLKVTDLEVKSRNIIKLDKANFEVREGEILAIAGVEGNGQKQIAEAISGLNKRFNGQIELLVQDKKNKTTDFKKINKTSIRKRALWGINHIPEDRHKYGMILDMSISENMMIRKYREKPYSYFGILNPRRMKKDAVEILNKYDVRGVDRGDAPARGLSGGNQQKAVVGREISDNNSKLLLIFQATRGLDVGAIEYIHSQIIKARNENKAVLLISYDINEVMTLADRTAVMNGGKITGFLDRKDMTAEKIGKLMSRKGE